MVYGQEPIHEVLYKISKQLTAPLSYIFYDIAEQLVKSNDSLQNLWEQTFLKKWDHTAMKEREKEIFIQFGQTLGVHNLEQQQKQIQLAKVHLQRELTDASEEEKRFSNMFRALGVLFGLLLTLIFI
ncbi:stage III sporulation protein AB [Piscibacillus halophilus]|uniref:Stage III sporulation protein AB n=2 Tax=Piscibacillus halophilus TaxID=571933 RepID=A0A1H9AA74_9BACI|nr:stage III sporulation protein AB [Piscibacillus halophilus]